MKPTSTPPSEKSPHTLAFIGLAIWAIALTLLISNFTFQHTFALRDPANLGGGVPTDWFPAVTGETFTATHFLISDCGCSQAVAESLAKRGLRKGFAERVVLIGEDRAEWQTALEKRGFALKRVLAKEIPTTLAIEAAPLLLIQAKSGAALYRGGYSDRRPGAGSPLRDEEIYAQILAAEVTKPYPVYGCAASVALRKTLDPFRSKYGRTPAEKL